MCKTHLFHRFRIFLNAHRDADGKLGPLTHLAFNVDGAFHHIDNALGNGKPKTSPLLLTDRRCPLAGEFIKEVLLVFGTHANSRILDDNLIQAIAFAF